MSLDMSLNRLRNLYAQGKPAIGTFFSSLNTMAMECLSRTGLDWVIIDMEHGPFDTETMGDLIQAAERNGLTPFVRVANADHRDIQRAADAGAQGLIIPCLRKVEEFKRAVDLAKFTPVGNRGFVYGRGCGFGLEKWAEGKTLTDYFLASNDRLMVIPQCETAEALDHIEEIVKLTGVDGIFIGPFDLSMSMGIPGEFQHQDFLEAKQRILNACKKEHKPCYNFSAIPENAVALLKEGFAGVAYNLDFNVLMYAYQRVIHTIREGVSAPDDKGEKYET